MLKLLARFVLWVMLFFIFGILSQGILFRLFLPPDLAEHGHIVFGVYLIGFFLTLQLYAIIIPVFAAMTGVWFLLCKKVQNFDSSWVGVVLFTLITAMVMFVSVPYLIDFFTGKSFEINDLSDYVDAPPVFLIATLGGLWFGLLLPRILFRKQLGPGKILEL
mgnify:CR=1 FL=1